MRLLLDTHALLWFLADDPKLSAAAKTAIEDPANERWLSPVSLLEIALKNRLGKLSLPVPFGAMFPVTRFATDIGFIHFDVPGKSANRTVLNRQANSVKHEPRSL